VLLNVWLTWHMLLPGASFRALAAGAIAGRNDFLSFYAGAVLAGTPDLYNPDRVSEVQMREAGRTGDSQKFIRLPCFALFLKPLSALPYHTAYLFWELLSVTALVAALVLWPGVSPTLKWLMACWFLPIVAGIFNGQDDTLVLFWIALSARLLHNGRPRLGGISLALAASKYHLILFIPILILAQKRWRMAAGIATGAVALLALSFATAGSDWPSRYLALLRNPQFAAELTNAPSFYANFQAMRFGSQFEIAAIILLAVIVFRISLNDRSFERPVALAIVCGILVSLHSWLADCTLLLPTLIATGGDENRFTRFASLLLLTPMPWLLLQSSAPLPTITRILMLGLVLSRFAHSEGLARRRGELTA